MTDTSSYRRRVGTVRPSHLMFTGGVGALVDLPNFAVLVSGLDDWRYDDIERVVLAEPRLLAAVNRFIGPNVRELRPAPWRDGLDADPGGPAAKVGVPVAPFPRWLRCTRCDVLAPLDSNEWSFENDMARRPDLARFSHNLCGRNRRGRKPLAVTARFLIACTDGHLDDFPYVPFVHGGGACQKMDHPTLEMLDHGGNIGVRVTIRCRNCDARRPMRETMGQNGVLNLPRCRGRHPHLLTFAPHGCDQQARVVVLGASNQWFAQTLSVLAVPESGQSALEAKVAQLWEYARVITSREILTAMLVTPTLESLRQWDESEVFDAIAKRHKELAGAAPTHHQNAYPDLLTPEWEVFTADRVPDPDPDFTMRRDPGRVPASLDGVLADVVQVERLREVRALIGFTRLDAPDPEEPDLVKRASLARDNPTWVPASEVRGEGIFLRLDSSLVADWEARVRGSAADHAHRAAYVEFRKNRLSDRIDRSAQDAMHGWPGLRYYALHTVSHVLIRTIALECGYSSASLSERIYAGDERDPRAGILIYTAVPDAEGTLGGLVSLAEPDTLERLMRRALRDAGRCSSDPLCAETLPGKFEDFLHGAACHACLFVSETTCERGNRFLDRRFIVPLAGDESLALLPSLG